MKEHHRSVSIVPNISKVYERCILKQLSNYSENFLAEVQCDFRQRFSAQHCLLAMIEKWKKYVDMFPRKTT